MKIQVFNLRNSDKLDLLSMSCISFVTLFSDIDAFLEDACFFNFLLCACKRAVDYIFTKSIVISNCMFRYIYTLPDLTFYTLSKTLHALSYRHRT